MSNSHESRSVNGSQAAVINLERERAREREKKKRKMCRGRFKQLWTAAGSGIDTVSWFHFYLFFVRRKGWMMNEHSRVPCSSLLIDWFLIFQCPVNREGHVSTKQNSPHQKLKSPLLSVSSVAFCEEKIWKKSELEWTGKAEIRTAEFLRVNEACKAIVCSTSGLKTEPS